eukprot:1265179-Pyramimonas_sp.AAC.2
MISSVHKAAPTRTLNPTIAVLVQSTARVLSIDISFWPPSYSIKEDKGRVRETEGFRLILKSLHDEMKKQAEMKDAKEKVAGLSPIYPSLASMLTHHIMNKVSPRDGPTVGSLREATPVTVSLPPSPWKRDGLTIPVGVFSIRRTP